MERNLGAAGHSGVGGVLSVSVAAQVSGMPNANYPKLTTATSGYELGSTPASRRRLTSSGFSRFP
jgi:hypothetical protein